MKKTLFLLVSLSVLCVFTFVQAQTVAPGWRVAGDVKADADFVGAWEVIAGYDLDNDGNREFFFTKDPTSSGGTEEIDKPWTVLQYETVGDDSYSEIWSWSPPFANRGERGFQAIEVGDADQDGLFELWFGTPYEVSDNPPNPDRLFIFEHDGAVFPTTPSESWNFGVVDNFRFLPAGIRLGDVDGDGEIEAVIQSRNDDFTGAGAGRTMLVVNTGGVDIGFGLGAFQTEFMETEKLKGGGVYDPRIVDFDRDGLMEIWVFTWDMFSLAIYEATAKDTYVLQIELDEVFDPIDYGQRMAARFYDADGDGELEMYTATLDGDGDLGSAIIYIGSTDDVSTLTPADVKILGGRTADPGQTGGAVGDIDGDGLMDYLFLAANPATQKISQVVRMEYTGTGDLADSTSYDWSVLFENTNTESDLRGITIDDVDGDNKTDVLVTNVDVASTDEAILYILESETAVSVEGKPVIVEDFSLFQNYPNPFNPSTTIEFDLRKSGHVTLTIYDVLGKRVATLVNEALQAGNHKVAFNAGNLESGIYFYSLNGTSFKDNGKMVLIK